MILKSLISAPLFFLATTVAGQLSLKNPQICHDKDNFLRCYNDGNCIVKFNHGDFEEFRTADSLVVYQNTQKIFTFYQKNFLTTASKDTIQLKLLPKSILLKRGNRSLEITSLQQIPSAASDFGTGSYTTNGIIDGFAFYTGNKSFDIKISTYGKTWSWDIKMHYESQLFSILYNSFKKNRLMYIFISDTTQKYGMVIGTTFRSLKKIDVLRSSYVDTMTIDGKTVVGEYPLDKYYYYEYNKLGKLKSRTHVGELKLCDCD